MLNPTNYRYVLLSKIVMFTFNYNILSFNLKKYNDQSCSPNFKLTFIEPCFTMDKRKNIYLPFINFLKKPLALFLDKRLDKLIIVALYYSKFKEVNYLEA